MSVQCGLCGTFGSCALHCPGAAAPAWVWEGSFPRPSAALPDLQAGGESLSASPAAALSLQGGTVRGAHKAPFATMWTKLEGIMLHEINKAEKEIS